MNAFAWIRNLTVILIMLLANFTTLKGANLLVFFILMIYTSGKKTMAKVKERQF